jgi:hypothetical protein
MRKPNDMEIREFVEATKALAKTTAAESSNEDPDSMGTYYEEQRLIAAVEGLFNAD